MRSVELFAGAGGLAIGMADAGFIHSAVIERDPYACRTFRENQKHHAPSVSGWPLLELDARNFDYSSLEGDIDVVSGGPPCQPFSVGGKHASYLDDRDMFPEVIRAVRELRPKAFIIENVRGLTRLNFLPYFSYIQLQLQHPYLQKDGDESWESHHTRLEKYHTSNTGPATYNVVISLLNAADFGIPQLRHRVFIVGFRSDLGISWTFPKTTHSFEALSYAKWVNKAYWERNKVSRKNRTRAPAYLDKRLAELTATECEAMLLPWITLREAIADLPDPEKRTRHVVANHIFVPGARIYAGHTGSALDEPAKTLKAGRHGVPGGENMLVKDDGNVRYFTVRESARLQTFPDEYEFCGTWTHTMRQLGNAVPVRLAQIVAESVARSLRTHIQARTTSSNLIDP